jgi:hypothetical protein
MKVEGRGKTTQKEIRIFPLFLVVCCEVDKGRLLFASGIERELKIIHHTT